METFDLLCSRTRVGVDPAWRHCSGILPDLNAQARAQAWYGRRACRKSELIRARRSCSSFDLIEIFSRGWLDTLTRVAPLNHRRARCGLGRAAPSSNH